VRWRRCRPRRRRSPRGRFSTDDVDLLARANQTWRNAVFADHEQLLVDEITGLRYHKARRVIDDWCQQADTQADDDKAQRDRDNVHLHASTTIDGNVVIDGVLGSPWRSGRHQRTAATRTRAVPRRQTQRRGAYRVATPRRRPGADGDDAPSDRPDDT
jgi:hypothetical protein